MRSWHIATAIAGVLITVIGACKDRRDSRSGSEVRVDDARPRPVTARPDAAPPVSPRALVAARLASCVMSKRPGASEGAAAEDSPDGTLADCYADDVVATLMDAVPPVRLEGKRAVTAPGAYTFAGALPDAAWTLYMSIVKGNEAVLIWHAQADARANAPAIGISGASYLYYNEARQITRHEVFVDQLSVLGQREKLDLPHRPQAPPPAGKPTRKLALGTPTEAENLLEARSLLMHHAEHSASLMASHYAPDATLIQYWLPGESSGIPAITAAYERAFAMSSDATNTLQHTWAAEDYVVSRVTREGAHTGELFGVPGENRRYSVEQLHIFRLENRVIKDHWVFTNGYSLAVQLGIARD